MLRRSWQLMIRHFWPLAQIVLGLYVPFYALRLVTTGAGWLPEDAADHLFGLLEALLAPVGTAMLIYRIHAFHSGKAAPLGATFAAFRGCWTRLLAVSIGVGLITFGWAALAMLPAAAIASLVLKIQDPLVLGTVVLGPGILVGTVVMSRYAFVEPLVVLAGLGPWQARQRSAALATGQRRRIIRYWLLVAALPFLVTNLTELTHAQWSAYLEPLLPGALMGWHVEVADAVACLINLGAALLEIYSTVLFYLYYREMTEEPQHENA